MTDAHISTELLNKIQEILGRAKKLLNEQLPQTGPLIIKHVSILDSYSFTINYYTAILNEHLTKLEFELLPDKSYGNIKEREIKMKAETAGIRKVIDILEGAYEAVKRRVNLAQSILSYLRTEEATKHIGAA